MSSSSGARVPFAQPQIHFRDNGQDRIYDAIPQDRNQIVSRKTALDLQPRLNRLITNHPGEVTITGTPLRIGQNQPIELIMAGPVTVNRDVSYRHHTDEPKSVRRIGALASFTHKRVPVNGVVIYGQARIPGEQTIVQYTIWPSLGKGAYVDTTNFAYFDELGRLIRPGSDANPLVSSPETLAPMPA